MPEKSPIMPIGIEAIVTILGGALAILGCVLVYQLITNGYDWSLLLGSFVTLSIAIDCLGGVFTHRYPLIVLIWSVPTGFDDN